MSAITGQFHRRRPRRRRPSLYSLDASTGETPCPTGPPGHRGRGGRRRPRRRGQSPGLLRPRRNAAPSSSTPSPSRSTPSATTSSSWFAARPPCRPRASRVSAAVPAGRCACSPGAAPWRLPRRAHRPRPARAPATAAPDLRQYRTGVGPCGGVRRQQLPLAFSTAGGDTAAALAAGCPVVFKAHSGHGNRRAGGPGDHPRRQADRHAGLAVFNMVYGGGVGEWLVKHPAIQAVGFTGSLRAVAPCRHMAAARPHPIRCSPDELDQPVLMLPGRPRCRVARKSP